MSRDPAVELSTRRASRSDVAELRERLQLAELRHVELELSRDLAHRASSGRRHPRARRRVPAFIAGRMPALNRSASR